MIIGKYVIISSFEGDTEEVDKMCGYEVELRFLEACGHLIYVEGVVCRVCSWGDQKWTFLGAIQHVNLPWKNWEQPDPHLDYGS